MPDGCAWFSVNPTKGPQRHRSGRGAERDVTRWAALYLDLDIKNVAFTGLDQIGKFIASLSGKVGQYPSALIFSGHGVQPLWVIEDPDNAVLDTSEKWERAHRLSRRFGRLAAIVAWLEFGKRLDTVSDLSRLLRVPGTTNFKDSDKPRPVVAVCDIGGPLTVDRIEEFLDEWTPEIASEERVTEEVLSPPQDWKFGTSTCTYVTAMVRSWGSPSDEPKAGRHQWAVTRCVRLAAAHRLGCISQHGLDGALTVLESALRHWCQAVGVPRDLAPDEVGSAYRWAEAEVATFDNQRARFELGNHQHCSAQIRTWTLVPT